MDNKELGKEIHQIIDSIKNNEVVEESLTDMESNLVK